MLKPTTGTNPRHNNTADLCDGWVTFHRIRMPDGRTALVQKNDGSTRTILTTGAQR